MYEVGAHEDSIQPVGRQVVEGMTSWETCCRDNGKQCSRREEAGSIQQKEQRNSCATRLQSNWTSPCARRGSKTRS